MGKPIYSVDLVNTHTGFLGKFELDLLVTTCKNVDFAYQVIMRDDAYQNVPFTRNFPTFRQARAFFLLCLESEHTILEVSDMYQLAKDFYTGALSSGGNV